MDDLNYKGPRDRATISLHEDWEVKWWTKALAISVAELKKAVATVGNSAQKVKEYVKNKK